MPVVAQHQLFVSLFLEKNWLFFFASLAKFTWQAEVAFLSLLPPPPALPSAPSSFHFFQNWSWLQRTLIASRHSINAGGRDSLHGDFNPILVFTGCIDALFVALTTKP